MEEQLSDIIIAKQISRAIDDFLEKEPVDWDEDLKKKCWNLQQRMADLKASLTRLRFCTKEDLKSQLEELESSLVDLYMSL